METVSEDKLRVALWKRKTEILDNLETLTLKQLRKKLATDLGVDADVLKAQKDQIEQLLDTLLKESQEPASTSGKTEPSGTGKRKETKAAARKSGAGKHDSDTKVRVAKENKPVNREKPTVKARVLKEKQNDAAERLVAKLKDICKQADIRIPPAIYRKVDSDEQLSSKLEELLEKHGLDRNSGPRQILAAKTRQQKQRELEGINLDNILDTGRRRRTAAAAVDYSKLLKPKLEDGEDDDSEEEEEEEEEEESSEDEEGGDVENNDVSNNGEESDAERDEEPKSNTSQAESSKPSSLRKRKSNGDSKDVESDGQPEGGSGSAEDSDVVGEKSDGDQGGNSEGSGDGPKASKKRRPVVDWSDDKD